MSPATLRTFLSLLLLAAALPAAATAQCEGCAPVPAESIDFCYQSADCPGCCASFSHGVNYFHLQNPANAKFSALRKINLPLVRNNAWLLSLQNDKAVRATAEELLFLRDALASWEVVDALYHWDTVALAQGWTLRPSGLAWRMIRKGTGKMPQNGKAVRLHYTGWLPDGTEFDSSVNQHQAYSFVPGNREVISGWEEAVILFPVGSHVLLRIPPALAYGSRPHGSIPANSILYFKVHILSTE